MKSLIITAVSFGTLSLAAPAMAQSVDLSHMNLYGSLGDSYLSTRGDGGIDEIQGRVGAQLGQYWGVEGEIGGGLSLNKYTPSGARTAATRYTTEPVAGAGYLVGYLPVAPRWQVLGRVGYGASAFDQTVNGVRSSGVANSVNFGVGAQYALTDKDAIRVDYTRRDYLGSSALPYADAWGLSFVRKF